MNLQENNVLNFEAKGINIDLSEIQNLIPHRYPFLLVDKVVDVHLGESAIGVKNVSLNEWFISEAQHERLSQFQLYFQSRFYRCASAQCF